MKSRLSPVALRKKRWTHRNTKLALILHPTDTRKVLQVIPTDSKGVAWYKWKCKNIPGEFYSAGNELLLLCVKYLIA